MPDPVPAELQKRVLDRIDDEEIVRLASDLIRIPSFTTEETPCAEWLAGYLGGQGLAVTPAFMLKMPWPKSLPSAIHGVNGSRVQPLASGSMSM